MAVSTPHSAPPVYISSSNPQSVTCPSYIVRTESRYGVALVRARTQWQKHERRVEDSWALAVLAALRHNVIRQGSSGGSEGTVICPILPSSGGPPKPPNITASEGLGKRHYIRTWLSFIAALILILCNKHACGSPKAATSSLTGRILQDISNPSLPYRPAVHVHF
ncbi:hypothetical protein VUR80DRAFT_6214 [Thermomyces stellatus]